jgi:hypothetical protein
MRAETDFPNYYTAAVLVLKGEKLHNYYDWTWFQRQINYAGIERQLGGYIPQTPLTMLPVVPLAAFPPQTAKRIWLIASLGFLGGTVWLLSSITQLRMTDIWLLASVGYGSIHVNFLLGQYYLFLLFLLTLAVYCLQQNRFRSSGFLFATAFALKLYGGPFFLYFAAKRRWQPLLGMLAGSLCFGAVAVGLFGWSEIVYFGREILPRALTGETLDPYNPGNGTISTLLRRTLMFEPELNPHPFLQAPWLFFFLQPLLTYAIVGIPLLALAQSTATKIDAAWFFVALLLASPNTASYTFILLLLPISLLVEQASRRKRLLLILCYFALTLPMRPSWNWLFPKVWFLLFLFILAGADYWRQIQIARALIGVAIIMLAAALIAKRSLVSYYQEPSQHWQRIAVERGAIYSSNPAVLKTGIVYESINADRYILRWQHGNQIDSLSFAGEAFHPVALSPEGPVWFELVANRTSTAMQFTPGVADASAQPTAIVYPTGFSVISPDGKWIAFTAAASGRKRILLRKFGDKNAITLTGGNCNSFAPAWDLDSKGIVFASDCGRGIGLPALYRACLSAIPVR